MATAFQQRWDWLFALGTIGLIWSLWGIGANDVANSYATSVAGRSLTLVQAGILATITEFVGAIALGARVTDTIRHGIISSDVFEQDPSVLILAMVTAEFGSAAWLTIATRWGFPVSTTQSIVGALVGVGIAARADVTWGWESGSVSQVVASWGIAPAIAGGFGIIIFGTMRLMILDRKDPLKWAIRLIPIYYGVTAGIFALFIVISGGHGIPSIEEIGAGNVVAIVLATTIGITLLSATFFVPYFYKRLVVGDNRLRYWHVPLGLHLLREDPWLYFPGKADSEITDYYGDRDNNGTEELNNKATEEIAGKSHDHKSKEGVRHRGQSDTSNYDDPTESSKDVDAEKIKELNEGSDASAGTEKGRCKVPRTVLQKLETDMEKERSWLSPRKYLAAVKYYALQGVFQDVHAHQAQGMSSKLARAPRFDNKVEHLWTTAQILSAMIMSIAHGANDVSNAIGPFTTEYVTWKNGAVVSEQDTPIWIPAVGGIGLGIGFWTYGFRIMRSLGLKITQISPTRGFAAELAAAITVLLASRLGLPVSTTQCVTGGIIGVALCNWDLKSINWKQLAYIFVGWLLTVPCAGLIAGLAMAIFVNTPHFLNRQF